MSSEIVPALEEEELISETLSSLSSDFETRLAQLSQGMPNFDYGSDSDTAVGEESNALGGIEDSNSREMSSEIVPALEEEEGISETTSLASYIEELNSSGHWIRPLEDSGSGLSTADAIRCKRAQEDIRGFDLLGLRAVGNSRIKVDLIGGNHHIRHFVAPEKGHQYVTHLNPTQASVKLALENMKEPSLLWLRGCDQLLQQSNFPFEKFMTLTALEISGGTNLTTLPVKLILELTQLQSLNLSHLLIETLPKGFFSDLGQLRWVNLRGCSKLRYLPSTGPLRLLEVLDLSHCTALQELEAMSITSPKFKMLDLSYTALLHTPNIHTFHDALTHLFLREAKVVDVGDFMMETHLEVIDLSGAQNVKDIDCLERHDRLEVLDLSRTGIESIDFITGMFRLRRLILTGCTRLVRLPSMEKLTVLEVLDLSGCEMLGDLPDDLINLINLKELILSGCSCLRELREGLFDQMSFLEKLDLSKTSINHLPSFANLTNLRTLNISQTPVEEVPDLSNLVNLRELFIADCQKVKGVPAGLQTPTNLKTLDLAPPTSGEIDFIEERISKPSEFHLVSTFFNESAFDQFKQKFDVLVGLISKIQENLKSNTLDTTSSPTTNSAISATNSETFACTANEDFNATNVVSCDISSQTFSRQFRRILFDLEYIRDNIDLLESSRNGTSAVELLNDLMKASDNLSIFDFPSDSPNLFELLRTVVKLKLLVPPKQVGALEKNEKRNKKKKEKFTKRIMKKGEHVSVSDYDIDMDPPKKMQNLSRSYDSLTNTQRKCLLYFAVFPRRTRSMTLQINERIIIQLWYAEGFIDPQHEENVALSSANSTDNPTAYSNPSPEIMGTSTETGATRNDAKLVYTTKAVESPNTIEEIGQKTLMVLLKKRFINRSSLRHCWKPYIWKMEYHVRSFVRARAKAEGLFGFNNKNGKLTPQFCLLKSQNNYPSSCKLWPNYTNSSEKLESFKTVRTLMNLDESIVNIRAEWFSKMRNLHVLRLGRWDYQNIMAFQDDDDFDTDDGDGSIMEVVDLKFLEELKNMEQLRLLSLEGFSTITKLPNSVCKLANLKILDLRECSYLEELPADIGSLKNLTHLDLTDCHVLYKLPKGLRFLSKLEVLKGFVITYQIGGRQHRNACTLRELLKLEKLRKLNLVVNSKKFPNNEDCQVFKEMRNLCNLKITWEKSYNNDQASHDVVGHKALRQLRCWEQQTRQHETEEPSTSNPFDNLRKLVMCCFPLKTAPSWLHPSGLQKLEKLYILGGELATLVGDTNHNTWNVKTLCLRHLPNLDMEWKELRHIFSNMTYCHQYDCDVQNFPSWSEWNEDEDI